MQIEIAVGKNKASKKWKNTKFDWLDLVKLLTTVHRTHETQAEYSKMSIAQKSAIKDVGGFVGGFVKDGRRLDGNVINRSLITLDVDFADADFLEDFELFNAYECAVYTTHSHTASKPKFRLIFPLDRVVTPDEYGAISRKIALDIGIDYMDDTTYQANRLMFFPSASVDGEFIGKHLEGVFVKADGVLATYTDWTDISAWAESSRSAGLHKKTATKQGDPLGKKGVIGAFCRTYDIHDAIATFLAGVYEPCDVPNRYTYAEGSTSAGVITYDDKFAYSNHASDPISMKLCNAFDLVRLHRFIDLDEGVEADTPVVKRPSYLAMQDFALADKSVKLLLGKEKLADSKEEFDVIEASIDWVSQMDLDSKGNFRSTIHNVVLILENDPDLKEGLVGWDLLADRDRVANTSLPWLSNSDYWDDDDESNLRMYLEKIYSIRGAKLIEDGINIVFNKLAYHPVRQYVDGLVWDGGGRLDTLLIDVLGADDTPYVRAVTRLHICAAIARAYVPGIKYDHVLVLSGPQGLGKSYLIELLSNGWYTDSIHTTKGKEAYEALDGAWLVEMAEMTATRKADVESVKQFITKTEDSYRKAYGRRNSVAKRQCVFFGTTNSKEFLRDTTGNRRFLPVQVGQSKPLLPINKLTKKYLAQVLAEAKHFWDKGLKLYLEGDLLELATAQQKEHLELDAWASDIENYIVKPLPNNWADLDLHERRDFLNGDLLTTESLSFRRDRVCVREIWTELLGKNWADINNVYRSRILGVLETLNHLEKQNKAMKFGNLHGLQKGYRVYQPSEIPIK